VDISALVIGASLHVNEIKVPAGVTVLNKPELPVFSVQMPKEETLTPAAAATTAAEPELIKKKGEEGEEGKAPEAGAKPAAAAGDAKAAPKADKK
jgi:large subunit ribosomal protein L25